MNPQDRIPGVNESGSQASTEAALKSLDATLHLLTTLPAPAGIEDRVFAGMLGASRKARILEWPQPLHTRDWIRGIAAAAIVLAVGGGGWGLYSHVKPNVPTHAVAAPHTTFQPRGFSSAEMIRRPQTLNGPAVKQTEPADTAKAKAAKIEAAKAKVAKPATAKLTTAKEPAPKAAAHGSHAVKATAGQSPAQNLR